MRFNFRKQIRVGPLFHPGVRYHPQLHPWQYHGQHARTGQRPVRRPSQGTELTVADPRPSQWGRVAVLAPALVVAACAVAARRFATNQYWRRHNIIWQKGWDDAMEIRDAHLNAYEADPERYVAEHGLSLVRGVTAR